MLILWSKQWADYFCDVVNIGFICEYEYKTPPPEQTTPDTTEKGPPGGKVRPNRRSPSRVSRVPKKTTIHKTASGKRVIGVPLKTKLVPVVTMCARLCNADTVCTVFNIRGYRIL